MRQKRRHAPHRARPAFAIIQRDRAFGRGIEFQDSRNGEALLETPPHILPQAIAETQAQKVPRFRLDGR
jgi:hypothetical protein